MRLPTVHDGRSLLQRPENQVRSVRGHVQVPCTGLLAGAPHMSKGQGAKGTAATDGGSSSDVLVLVVKFKAYVAMLRCWCTSPDAREKK